MTIVIFRYLFAEAARTWIVVAGVLLFMTLGLGFTRYIADAAAGELPVNMVLSLAFFQLVENLEIVMPVSVLLALLLTLGRLSRDNELAAVLAGGAGLRIVYSPFMVLAIVVATIAGAVSMFAAPRAEQAMDRIGAEGAATVLDTLAPGRFRTFLDGDAVFYAESRDDEANLRDIFIRVDRGGNSQNGPTVVTAERARRQTGGDDGAVTLILDDGWRYEGRPGSADYRIIRFEEHGVRVAARSRDEGGDVETLSLVQLIDSDDPEAAAEWQTRVSVPVSILILALLAMPVGRVPPRAGRYARVIVGILLYVIYVNGVHLASVAVEEGSLSPWLGVWWVHGLVLALAAGLIMREQGVITRMIGRGDA